MRTWLRRAAKILGVLLLLVLLLPLALFLALQHESARSMVVNWALDAVNDEIDGHIEVDRVGGSLLGAATVEGVRIYDGHNRLAAEIEEGSVRFQLLPLIGRRAVIERLDVDSVTAVVRIYEDGTLNWATLAEPDPDDEPTDFVIHLQELNLGDIAVAYLNETTDYEEYPGLGQWRARRIEDLDAVRTGQELRARFSEAFDPDAIATFAEPRAPVAAWITDLEARADAVVHGEELEATLSSLAAQLQTDIFAEQLALAISTVEVQGAESTLVAAMAEFLIEDWLRVENLSVGMVLPPEALERVGDDDETGPDERKQARLEAAEIEERENGIGGVAVPAAGPDDPFELAIVNLGRLVVFDPLLSWAAPEQEFHAPLFLEARIAADPVTAHVHAQLQSERSEHPVRASARIDDYGEDLPRYVVALFAEELRPEQWVVMDELPEVVTTLRLHVEGQGFDPDTLTARARTRIDDTVVDGYALDLFHADIRIDQGVVEGDRFSLFSPYLDAFGSFRLDPAGTARFQLRTTADADQTERAARFADARPVQADLAIDAEAHFDPEVDDLMESLQALEARAQWDFRAFRAEEIYVGQSAGEMSLDLERLTAADEAPRYQGSYRLVASGHNITTPELEVGVFEARDRGQFTVALPFEDPLESLQTFRNQARIDVRDVVTAELRLARAQVAINADKPRHARNRLGARINADLSGIHTEQASVGEASALFSTSVVIGEGEEVFEQIRRFELSGTARAQRIRADEIFAERAELELELSGRPARPQGEIHLAIEEIFAFDEELPRATVSVVLEEPGEGQIDLEVFRTQAQRYFFSSLFSVDAEQATGTLTAPSFGTDRAEWSSQEDSVLRWTGERLVIDELLLENEQQSIFVDGFFHPDHSQNLNLVIENFDLRRLRRDFYLEEDMPDVEGELQLRAGLDGTARQPEIDLRGQLTRFHFEGEGPLALHFSLGYENERARIRHLRAFGFGRQLAEMTASLPVALDLDGRFDLFWDRPFEARLRLAEIDLEDFHQPVDVLDDYNVRGRLAGFFHATGELEDPILEMEFRLQDFAMQGEVDGDFVDLHDIDMFSRLHYHSRENGGDGLHLATNVTWEEETLLEFLLETPLPIEEWAWALYEEQEEPIVWSDEFANLPLRLRLLLPELDLRRIPLESVQELNLAGTIAMDVDIEGTIANPRGRLDASLDRVGFDRFRDLNFELNTVLREQQAIFEHISFVWGRDEIFVAEGNIPLPMNTLLTGEPIDDIPISFRWQLQEIPISRLSPIDYSFARIRGSLAAFVELEGTVRNPEFRSRAGIFNTRMGDGQPGTIYMELSGADNEITVNGAACHRVDPVLSFTGRAPVLMDIVELARGTDWQLDGPLFFHVESEEMDLAQVIPTQLVADVLVDPSGMLALDFMVEGTWEEPDFGGFLLVEDAAFTFPQYSRRLTNINGRVDIDDEEIVIPSFSIADGPSTALVTGTISHDFFIPQHLDLAIQTNQFNVGGFGVDFPVFVTSRIAINGTIFDEPGELTVHISDLEVVVTDEWDVGLHSTSLDDDIIVLRRDGDLPPAAEIMEAEQNGLADLHLRVNVILDRNSWARHPNGDINLAADLTAEITGGLTVITGNVDLLRGELEFLGRRFVIQPSQIGFAGAHPPNPRLQLEAHHPLDRAIIQALGPPATGEPRIIFRITGTADAPRLELQSDPPMNDTEILFVLMTGRPPDRTGIGQDEGVAAQALAAVGGLFFGMLQDQLAGQVPVDVLRLDPGLPGAEGGRLEVGKYLTNNLFLSYRRQFGADEDTAANIIRLEYHFLPRWMFELVYTDRNEGGVNIYWDAL